MVLTTNLEVYYSLDDDDLTGGEADDLTGNGHNGTNAGTPTTGSTGKVGECFTFDGSDDTIDIGWTQADFSTDFSISFWFKTTSNDNSEWITGIDEGANDTQLFVGLNAGDFYVYLRDDSASPNVTVTDSSQDWSDGAWHHGVVTYEGGAGELKLYLDGGSPTTDSDGTMGTCATSEGTLHVSGVVDSGGGGGATIGFFDGLIDEFGWWNSRVLSSADVASLYGSGSGLAYPLTVPVTIFSGTGKAAIGATEEDYFFDGKIDDVRFYDEALGSTDKTEIYNSGTGTESAGTISVDTPNQRMIFDSNKFTTNKLSTTATNITKATLTAGNLEGASNLSYYLSADDGSNFELVKLNTEHIFTNTGKNLKLKILSSGGGTVAIQDGVGNETPIKIKYT